MLVLGLGLLVAAACGGFPSAAATPPPGPLITLAEFDAIATGMPCDRLAGLVGGPGRVLVESAEGGFRTVVYGWDGRGDAGANASVTCQDGTVVLKAQAGLR